MVSPLSLCFLAPTTKANNTHWCVIHMLNRGIQALVPRLTNLLSPKTQPFLHADWMCEQHLHLQIPTGEYQAFFKAVLEPLWRWTRKRGWVFCLVFSRSCDKQLAVISGCLSEWSSLDSEVLFWTSVLHLTLRDLTPSALVPFISAIFVILSPFWYHGSQIIKECFNK